MSCLRPCAGDRERQPVNAKKGALRGSPHTLCHDLHQLETPGPPGAQHRMRRGDPPMKVCDLTQFYSPFSGGVKRYVEEKRKYANALGHEHLLIVPGKRTQKIEKEESKKFLSGY